MPRARLNLRSFHQQVAIPMSHVQPYDLDESRFCGHVKRHKQPCALCARIYKGPLAAAVASDRCRQQRTCHVF